MSQRLFLIWKADSMNGENFPIGALDFDGECYEFRYLSGLRAAREKGFTLLPEFSDDERTYRSEHLFPLFSNRIVQSGQKKFPEYIRALGLEQQDSKWMPLYMLDRSRGLRATDSYRLFLCPEPQAGCFRVRTFTSGATRDRFYDNLLRFSRKKNPPANLLLRREPENKYDNNALLVMDAGGLELGFVPAYYASELSPRIRKRDQVDCRLVQFNTPVSQWGPDVLLIELECSWPKDWQPFSTGMYEEYRSAVSV